jgi:ubiquinone/menaquinone biosynthesis C-methylase UbiE
MSIEEPKRNKNEGRIEPLGIAESSLYPIINERLRNRYDRIAPQWNTDAYAGTRRDDLIPTLIDLLGVNQEPKTILEAMCGTARMSQALALTNPSHDIYALDFSLGMLSQIPASIKRIQASVVAMPFADKVFDRICIRNALYDLPRRLQIQALQEIRRVMSDDGVFVLQNYYTTPETFEHLNELVKRKDIAGSQNEDMGSERFPRYFAPIDEFEGWLSSAHFEFTRESMFEGEIRYMRTAEMIDADLWVTYAQSLPDNVKEVLKLRTEDDGTLTYNFPGIVYKVKKSVQK